MFGVHLVFRHWCISLYIHVYPTISSFYPHVPRYKFPFTSGPLLQRSMWRAITSSKSRYIFPSTWQVLLVFAKDCWPIGGIGRSTKRLKFIGNLESLSVVVVPGHRTALNSAFQRKTIKSAYTCLTYSPLKVDGSESWVAPSCAIYVKTKWGIDGSIPFKTGQLSHLCP